MRHTILVAVAHPDDVELTCAGSIARWVHEGSTAVLVLATDGSRGGKLPLSDSVEVSRMRKREQEEAAALLGFAHVVWLNFPDGDLEEDSSLRGALVRQVRQFKPQTVITMDPTHVIQRNAYVNHRDHRILGMALLDALYPQSSNAGYFPEHLEAGLEIHKVAELLLSNPGEPNFWVDVSDTLDVRFEALRRHRSQLRLWPENGEAIIREQKEIASILGLQRGTRYAEEFRRVVVNPLA